MTSIEQTGRTVEDAVKAALKILGVAREDVDVEVLSQESRGLLGILGYSEAKVRVTVKASLTAPETPKPTTAWHDREAQPEEEEEPLPPGLLVEEGESVPYTEVAYRAAELLDEILSHMGLTARSELTREDTESIFINITDEEDLGLLIGKRGQTLAALQLIVAMMANREFPPEARKRIILDAADYRARRERALVTMARTAAERARRTGREVPLQALTPRERRVIHMTLAHDASVTTRSEGDEPDRHVVIVPKRRRERRPY